MIHILLFLTSFAVYLSTLCPTVYLGDSGELLVGAYRLGVPHPPGYPAFVILGKLFTAMIPLGDAGFRVNLMAAVSSSFSAVFLYMIMMNLIEGKFSKLISFSCALCFAFSRTLWSQSVISEVYALNMFFICLLIWHMSKEDSKDTGFVFPCAFLAFYGISFTYHPTNWLLGPIFVIFIFTKLHKRFNYPYIILPTVIVFFAGLSLKNQFPFLKILLAVFGLIFLLFVLLILRKWFSRDNIGGLMLICTAFIGISLYIYFPLSSLTNPIIDWGNPDNLHKVIRHVLRKQYKALGGGADIGMYLSQVKAYLEYILAQINPVLCLLAFMGGSIHMFTAKKFKLFSEIFLIGVALGVIGFVNYKPTYHQMELVSVFFLPSVIIIAMWIGIAFHTLLRWFSEIPPLKNLALSFIIASPFLPLLTHYKSNNQSMNTIAYNSGYDMLTVFPEKAVLFTAGDFTAFPIAYLQMIEEYRTDVEIFDDYGSLFRNIYGDDFLEQPGNLQPQIRRNAQFQFVKNNRYVYCTLGAEISNWTKVLEPEGLNYRVNPKDVSWGTQKFWVVSSVRAFVNRYNTNDTATLNILNQYEFGIGEYYFVTGRSKLGLKHYKISCAREKEFEWLPNNMATMLPRRGFPQEVEFFQRKVIELNPWYSQAYLGLGVQAMQNKNKDEAKKMFERVVENDPYSVMAHFQLGNIYSEEAGIFTSEGRRQEAIEKLKMSKHEYIKALTYDPNHVSAHKNLASVLMELGEREAALSETTKAIQLNPQDYQLHFNKGAIEYALGKYQDAIADWQKASQMNPNDPRPKQHIEELLKKLKNKQ